MDFVELRKFEECTTETNVSYDILNKGVLEGYNKCKEK